MAEVRLQTDVKEAGDGQNLVDDRVAEGRVDGGCDEEVLDRLEELHREEEEHSRRQFGVEGPRIDPVRCEQAEGCKGSRHFH